MLQHRLARRNSLRSLRELRSDRAPREWSTKRAARAAGAAALLGCAQARRPRAAHAFADTVVDCADNSPVFGSALALAPSTASAFGQNTTHGARAAVGGRPGPGVAALCAAPSSAVSGSARAARFVLLTCGALS